MTGQSLSPLLVEIEPQGLERAIHHAMGGKTIFLARAWILPIIIFCGLSAAWAAPWSFGNASLFQISKVITPLLAQAALSGITSILAYRGKAAWLGLLIGTFAISLLNGVGFTLGIWGVQLPLTQNIVLILAAFALIPTLIWGRKSLNYEVQTDVPTWSIENSDSDW